MRRVCEIFDCYNPAVDYVEFHSSDCPALAAAKDGCICGPIQRIWLCSEHFDHQETIVGQRVKPSALA